MLCLLLLLLLTTPAQALPLLDSESTFSGSAMEAHDVTTRGGVAYVAAENRFYTWDVSDPTNILPLGQFVTTEARGVDVDGTLAFVADGNRFRVLDVSNPALPAQLDLVVQDEAVDVAVNPATKLAYVANSTGIGDIDVVDYTDPNNITIVASVTAVSNPQGVFFANDVLYLADGLAGLKIYDVSGVVPVQTGFFSNSRFYNGVTVKDGFIYAVDNTFGLTTLEETGGNPILRSAIPVNGSPKDVTANCTGLYLVTSIATSELRAYNILNPALPVLDDTTFIGGVDIESLDMVGDVVFTVGTSASPKLALYDADLFCDDMDGDGACLCGDPCPSFPNTLPLPEPFTVGDENGDSIPTTCQCGDANDNGSIDNNDLTTIFQCLNGDIPAAVCAANLATGKMESNHNFAIDNNDLTRIFFALNGDIENYNLVCANRPEGTPVP